jgi:hypothetical protein
MCVHKEFCLVSLRLTESRRFSLVWNCRGSKHARSLPPLRTDWRIFSIPGFGQPIPNRSEAQVTVVGVADWLRGRCVSVLRMMRRGELRALSDEDGKSHFDRAKVVGRRSPAIITISPPGVAAPKSAGEHSPKVAGQVASRRPVAQTQDSFSDSALANLRPAFAAQVMAPINGRRV